MSQRAPKRRLHVDIKRRWRSRKQENKINTFLDSAYHFDSTNTDEEEINLHVTQEPVIDYSISSEIRTDSDSEFIRNENENNHDDHSIDDTDKKCGEVLLKSNDAKCSISCDSNGKYRSYSKIAELAIMNVEREIKRVAERHIDLINEYPKQAPYLFTSDHISSNIYRQLPTNENQRNITIILHSDGAPAVGVNNKSLWPVQAIIAEIPIPVRDMKSAVMLFGVWLAAKKPPRNPLLIPIITQLEVLMRSPIVLKQKDGSRLSYNVRIQQAIFDLPARAHFLNIVQYNGYYGCGDCCIEGVAIGRQVYFPFSKKTEKLKDHQFYLRNAKINDGRFIQGIKGPTPLSSILLLPYQTPMYVLASFSKKKKHAIIPKHQVTIDVIDEQNGSIRSFGFVPPVRIIAEGTRTKCQEKASQFSRNTGSEEIDIQPANNDEDEELDDNHIYTTKNFYNNDENEPLPQATDFHSNYNVNEPSLDFDSIVAYQNVKKTTKRMAFDDDYDDQLEEETLNMASGNRHKNNSKKKKDDSSSKQLFIDEHTNNEQHTQENLSNPSNVTDDLSYICEQGDDEDDVPPTQSKPIKNKRKRTSRSKESSSKSSADIEITNVQKELFLFQYKVDNRLKVLEKTFRILKSRKFLKENKNLMNITDLAAHSVPPPPDPEIVLGVDVSKLIFKFDEQRIHPIPQC
ncbi:unnamed protein product [Rotaria socialis]